MLKENIIVPVDWYTYSAQVPFHFFIYLGTCLERSALTLTASISPLSCDGGHKEPLIVSIVSCPSSTIDVTLRPFFPQVSLLRDRLNTLSFLYHHVFISFINYTCSQGGTLAVTPTLPCISPYWKPSADFQLVRLIHVPRALWSVPLNVAYWPASAITLILGRSLLRKGRSGIVYMYT